MAKMLQIRDMPDEVHRRLKVRASHAGMTLQQYVLSELKAVAERPTPDEVLARLGDLPPVRVGVDEIVDAVRAGRVDLVEPGRAGEGEAAMAEVDGEGDPEGDAAAAATAAAPDDGAAHAADRDGAEAARVESQT
jgi:plasmid stability protein